MRHNQRLYHMYQYLLGELQELEVKVGKAKEQERLKDAGLAGLAAGMRGTAGTPNAGTGGGANEMKKQSAGPGLTVTVSDHTGSTTVIK